MSFPLPQISTPLVSLPSLILMFVVTLAIMYEFPLRSSYWVESMDLHSRSHWEMPIDWATGKLRKEEHALLWWSLIVI